MKIVADYKKRKELKEYLPHEDHWKLKSQDRKSVESKVTGSTTILAQLSPNSAAALADTTEKLTTQTSEERKRSISDIESGPPPTKKCNVENEVISENITASENGNGAAA